MIIRTRQILEPYKKIFLWSDAQLYTLKKCIKVASLEENIYKLNTIEIISSPLQRFKISGK